MSEAIAAQDQPDKRTEESAEGARPDLLDLPFDQYQRYQDVREVVQRLRGGAKPLRILDVGGGEGSYLPAPDFFPDDFVLVADLHDFKLANYIRASGLDLPFADGSFDVVFSCDTLEHLRADDRERFLRELFRVSARWVVLVAPFQSPLAELAEQIVQDVHVAEFGDCNRALREHSDCGLPDFARTEAVFQALSAACRSFPSGNLYNWIAMNTVTFTLAQAGGGLERAASRAYNTEFYSIDHASPAYRRCLFAAKTEADALAFAQIQEELVSWLAPAGQGKLLDADALAQLDPGREIAARRSALARFEQILGDKDVHIGNIESQLHAAEGRLKAMESLVRAQQGELQAMQNSAAWQLVQRFWRWNMHRFPFGSRRRRIYEMTVGAVGSLLLGKRRRPRNLGRVLTYGTLSDEVPPPGKKSSGIELNCDEPAAGQQCGGSVAVRGWAVAPKGIEKIEISLNGTRLAQALYGQIRPDVAREHPDCKDAQNSGFLYIWDSTRVTEGAHRLSITAYSREGGRRELTIPVVIDHQLTANVYQFWIQLHEADAKELAAWAERAKGFRYKPLISIIMPVHRTPLELLRQAIASVKAQIYENWELCLCDDASRRPELTAALKDFAAADARIKVIELPENGGIAAATNAALTLAGGEFAAFLDHDDTLAPDALYHVVADLQRHSPPDLLYSDEDKLSPQGERFDPFFKPDWSPDLLLSMNYICHFLVVRRILLQQVGGLRLGFDGAQDYDLVLRLAERSPQVRHLPHVLYHWRQSESSTAANPEAKPRAAEAAQRALSEHLRHCQVAARVEPGIALGRWRVRYEITANPKVGIILPTGGRLELLRPCLQSLFSTTSYSHYEILLVDNSRESKVQEYISGLGDDRIRYIDYRNRPFNYSALNNFAVQQTQAPLLLFLNDDTTMVDAEWLTALVEHAQRPSVGVVGAKLVYPFGLIQHAGVVMGIFDNTAHAFRNLPENSRAYFDFPQVIRNCSAVTAACMLTKRDLFLELGGFNETRLAVAFQDVDYCLRVRQAGYFIVYTPYCMLIHHESVTKDEKLGNPREVRYMQEHWAEVIANDPFYSPNLTRKGEDYGLRMD